MTPTSLRSLVLPLAALLLFGCEEVEDFLPTVTFDALEPEEITFERAKVDFVFQVDNPNPIDVGLSSFSYDLGLEDVPLLSGDNEDGFQLEASGASELRLPIDLTWQGVFETIQATRGEDFVDFGLGGHFGFETPLGEARLPYQERGDFPALRTPRFRFQNLRVARIDTSNILNPVAEMELDLGVEHEQAATMFFDRFDYGVRLNGQPVADGLVNTFGVESQTEGGLTLPVNVNLVSAGAALFDVITSGGNVDVGLGASMDVDTPFGIVPLTIDEAGALHVDP